MNYIPLFIFSLWMLGVVYIVRKSIPSAVNKVARFLVARVRAFVAHDLDADFKSLPKAIWLMCLGAFFLFVASSHLLRYNSPFQFALNLLAIYCFYGMILETSSKLNGIKFPNAYKIVIAVIGLVAVIAIGGAWVNVTWAENWSNNIDSLFNGIFRLFDYFMENIEEIKDLIEWFNQLGASPAGLLTIG